MRQEVCVVGEEYTTQTCGRSGRLHQKIGSRETFVCPHPSCRYTCGRDESAARNIFLKHIREWRTTCFRDHPRVTDRLCPSSAVQCCILALRNLAWRWDPPGEAGFLTSFGGLGGQRSRDTLKL